MMKYTFIVFFILQLSAVIAQPKTDCVCNGSTAGGAKVYAGLGGDFHLMNIENDNGRYDVSTMGFNFHLGYNLKKNFSLQLGLQKYSLAGYEQTDKFNNTFRYSYLDLSLYGVYRFIKRGSRFIPYIQGGYTMNNTLSKEVSLITGTTEENGFSLQGNYAHLGGGTLFILANQFTIFAEGGLHLNVPSVFKGTYTNDIYRLKFGISVGVNYHF